MGDEKGAACCGEVSFFIGTVISPAFISPQPQRREAEQNSSSSTGELGGLESPEGSLSVQWLLNPGAQQSSGSGCHSSMAPGPDISEAEHASQEAHTHTNPCVRHI